MLTTADMNWDPKRRTLSIDRSIMEHSLRLRLSDTLTIISSHTGREITFKLSSVDKDASCEDIYGYNFTSSDTDIKVLIFND